MDLYDQVKKQWQMWAVRSGEDLDLRLDNFRILFAYNSGKIENAAISYHDTREIFENGRVVGYTGDPARCLNFKIRRSAMTSSGRRFLLRSRFPSH